MELTRDHLVVLSAVGVVRVLAVGEPSVAVDEDGGQYEIRLLSKVRELSSEDVAREAQSCFQKASQPVEKSKRARLYRHVHRASNLVEMAELLTCIYAVKNTDFLDERYHRVLEKAVFGELSAILGESVSSIKRRARRGVKGSGKTPRYLNAPERTSELDGASSLISQSDIGKTWAAAGALYVEDEIIVGEFAIGLKLKAQPGVWFVYTNSAEQDEIDTIVAVHSECTGEFETLKSVKSRKRLGIDGACMAVTDAWFAEDPDLRSELSSGESEIAGRCVNICLGGDGSAAVRHRKLDGRVVHIEISV